MNKLKAKNYNQFMQCFWWRQYYLSSRWEKRMSRSEELDCFSYKYRGIVAFKAATDTGIFSKP